MAFEGDYFQQSIGVIMGTDAAPILAIIYMARLENLLKEKYKTNERILGHFYLKDLLMTLLDYKSKWKIIWIWVRESITKDKFKYPNTMDWMDLFIFKGNHIFDRGKLDISVFQKKKTT